MTTVFVWVFVNLLWVSIALGALAAGGDTWKQLDGIFDISLMGFFWFFGGLVYIALFVKVKI